MPVITIRSVIVMFILDKRDYHNKNIAGHARQIISCGPQIKNVLKRSVAENDIKSRYELSEHLSFQI